MKEFTLAVCLTVGILLTCFTVRAQKAESDSLYVNYGRLLGGAVANFMKSSQGDLWSQSMKLIQESVASLREDIPASEYITPLKGTSSKTLSDEKIYSVRKNSVFMIAKLSANGSGGNTGFTFMGTGFAISADGICITNYHVLEELLIPSKASSGLVYLIIGRDNRAYALNKILAYSRNNDLAIFRVNTLGEKLDPIPLGKPAVTGAAAYCISNPGGQFHFFSKGLVARNTIPDSTSVSKYSKTGVTPIRMEITAEYGIGSSGAPVLDKSGNVIGIVANTSTLHLTQSGANGSSIRDAQMVFRATIPVKALTDLLISN